MSLDGRVAIVTGAGRGIGEAIARRLAAQGVRVVVAARSQDDVDRVAAEITGSGGAAWAYSCDVTDPNEVDALVEKVTASAGTPAQILVNNAGSSSADPIGRVSLEEWNRLFAVNATGTFLCTQAFLPGMVEAGWGRIVNVASVAGLHGAPYIAAYTASKHAQVGLTRAVAAEVASKGVTVNAVCPGYVDTPMTDASITRIVEKTGRSAEEARGILEKQNPQGRLITPEEVAHAVVSLCHPDAQGTTGQCLVLDGGATA